MTLFLRGLTYRVQDVVLREQTYRVQVVVPEWTDLWGTGCCS